MYSIQMVSKSHYSLKDMSLVSFWHGEGKQKTHSKASEENEEPLISWD